jgi:hypothetical protein
MTAVGRGFGALVRVQVRTLAHERGAWLVPGVAAAVVFGCGGLQAFNLAGDEARFGLSLARTVLVGAGALLAAWAAPVLLHAGRAPGWPALLAARGVSRPGWLAATLVALLVAQAWLAAAVALAFAAVAVRLGWGGWGAAGELLAAGAGPLAVVAAAALAAAAVFRRPLPAAAATLALAFAGHLAPGLDWIAARQDGASAAAWRLLDGLVPDLAAAPDAGVLAVQGLHTLWFAAVAAWVHAGRED